MRYSKLIGVSLALALAAVAVSLGATSALVAAPPSAPAPPPASAPVPAPAPATAPVPAHLVYADEFDGPLDTATWAPLTPWRTRFTTGELAYYDPTLTSVSGGQLHLLSTSHWAQYRPYSSAIVTSLGRSRFSYGYFEIRARLPEGRGTWPAFWLTNDGSLEIDVLEVLGDRTARDYMTLHQRGRQVYQGVYDGPDFSDGYHTFGVDWQPGYVRWYVDGVLRAAYEHPMPSDPLWITLDTAIGGVWGGPPDASTPFPQSFDIDYVRVWDRRPSAP